MIYYYYILLSFIYYHYHIIQLFSKNSTLSHGYRSDHNAVWQDCISILYRNVRCIIQNLHQIPLVLVKFRTFLNLIATHDCDTQQRNILQLFGWKIWNRRLKLTCKPFYYKNTSASSCFLKMLPTSHETRQHIMLESLT